jgi:hypothetical protein
MTQGFIYEAYDSDLGEVKNWILSAKEFLGSNSTLSWWAAKIRSKNGMNRSVLPVPWTVTKLNYETYLNIAGVNLSPAKFEL